MKNQEEGAAEVEENGHVDLPREFDRRCIICLNLNNEREYVFDR